MKTLFLVAACCVAASSVYAVPSTYGPEIPIPDSLILINYNGTGLDWIIAGAASPAHPVYAPFINTPDYRASEGWRYAALDEWATRPDWTDFLLPGVPVPTTEEELNTWGDDDDKVRFTSRYWADEYYMLGTDLNDAAIGLISRGLSIDEPDWEVWYVRTTGSSTFTPAVPDGGASGLLLGLSASGVAWLRRRSRN